MSWGRSHIVEVHIFFGLLYCLGDKIWLGWKYIPVGVVLLRKIYFWKKILLKGDKMLGEMLMTVLPLPTIDLLILGSMKSPTMAALVFSDKDKCRGWENIRISSRCSYLYLIINAMAFSTNNITCVNITELHTGFLQTRGNSLSRYLHTNSSVPQLPYSY